ncbi:MAG: heat-inducible transcriptional repressor HrcA [Dongiaceae bacterium]
MALTSTPSLTELDKRARLVLRQIIDSYLESGEPVGSRTIAQAGGIDLSPASIRHIMAELENLGLLASPHTSAGRLPTEAGLRLYVRGILETGNLAKEEAEQLAASLAARGKNLPEALLEAGQKLSGLSKLASIVVAPKAERALKHLEFVPLSQGRALAVLVSEDGGVENRLIEVPIGLPAAILIEASNYLSTRLLGKTLKAAREKILDELAANKAELNALTQKVVEAGLASWGDETGGALIVRGQANLLENVTALEDLEKIRRLFTALETEENLLKLLERTEGAGGVEIFIGAESGWFGVAGCAMIVAPYQDPHKKVVGAVGVIGPARMPYGRLIPMVDYTAQVLSKILS